MVKRIDLVGVTPGTTAVPLERTGNEQQATEKTVAHCLKFKH
ncbi:MAG: hypothetical protein N4J56_002083 [Chroococcidiopsis sp. SAG 2025]|nr:hypothetical protein [Chroococcidiopsis sp. SAG 2025]